MFINRSVQKDSANQNLNHTRVSEASSLLHLSSDFCYVAHAPTSGEWRDVVGLRVCCFHMGP